MPASEQKLLHVAPLTLVLLPVVLQDERIDLFASGVGKQQLFPIFLSCVSAPEESTTPEKGFGETDVAERRRSRRKGEIDRKPSGKATANCI